MSCLYFWIFFEAESVVSGSHRDRSSSREIAVMSSKTLLFETKTGEYSESPQFMHHIALKLVLQKSDAAAVSGSLHYVERSAGFYHDLEFTHFSKGHTCAVVDGHLVTTGHLYPLVVNKWLDAHAVKSVAESGGRRPVAAAPDGDLVVASADVPGASSWLKDMQFAIAPEPFGAVGFPGDMHSFVYAGR